MEVAVAFAFLASLGFGSGSVLIRLGAQALPSQAVTFFAVGTGAVLATILALIFDLSDMDDLPAVAYGWFAVLALLGYPMARLFNYTAISMIGATRAAPMDALRPVFALGLAVAFLGERPNLIVGLGTPVIVTGLILVIVGTMRPQNRATVTNNLGFLLAMAAALSFGTRDVISRHVVSDIATPLITSSFGFLMGVGMLSIISFPVVSRSLRRPLLASIGMCIVAGLFQGVANISVLQSLSRAPVTIVSPVYSATPLVVLVLSHIFLQRLEHINASLVIGTVLSVGGVVMVVVGAGI